MLVDSPSESATRPPSALDDGDTKLHFGSGLPELGQAGNLSDLPLIVISHGRRTFSTTQAERSWTRMQRQLARDSSNTLRVVALDSRHVIQYEQPDLVAAAIEDAASSFGKDGRLRCPSELAAHHGRCVR